MKRTRAEMAVVREQRRLKELKKRGDAIAMTGFGLAGASFYLRWKKDYPWPVVLFFATGGVVVMIAGFVVSRRARGKLADVVE